jgi:hypothetical protein
MSALASPYRSLAPAAGPRPPTRIEHKMWWCENLILTGWVKFQTYAWAEHGCWTYPTEPWIIVEMQP